MKHRNVQQQPSGINRREFCKTVPCAVAGVLISAGITRDLWKSGLPGNGIFKDKEETVPNIVKAKVISQEGTCGLGHKVGDVVTFTEHGVEGKICIHALYAILPKVFAMMYDANFPWLENPDVSTSACPDANNPLIFEISRKKT